MKKILAVIGVVLVLPLLFTLVGPPQAEASGPQVIAVAHAGHHWPVNGVVTSSFGFRQAPDRPGGEFHTGIDIAAASGTPVRAASAGTVVFAGTAGNYGRLVILRHEDTEGVYQTYYGHLQSLQVGGAGEIVQAGQVIGLVGSTGRSTGPHLHFEYRLRGGRSQDPMHLYR